MVDRRGALLDAAEEVLIERGLTATVEEITAAAGVAKGTFYLYFSRKEDVLRALQERLYDEYLAAAVRATTAVDALGWWGAVERFVTELVDLDIAHRDWHRLVGQGWTAPGPLTEADQEQQLIGVTEAAIQIGIERGECHAEDPELTATLLYRAIEGTCSQLCQSDEPIDRDRLRAAILELARKALAPA